jgi:hypothetical protein
MQDDIVCPKSLRYERDELYSANCHRFAYNNHGFALTRYVAGVRGNISYMVRLARLPEFFDEAKAKLRRDKTLVEFFPRNSLFELVERGWGRAHDD